MQTGLISTPEGPAFVRCIGNGPRVIVLHGGPGFDHEYLVEPLEFLAGRRCLVFYDQPGCGSTPPPAGGATPDHTFRHARSVLDTVCAKRPIGVIAHSWGALVLAGALAQDRSRTPAFTEGLLVNPTAINRRDYEISRANFASRIPFKTKLRILLAVTARFDGMRIMNMLLPYYADNPATGDPRPIRLNLETYRSVDRKLGDFDFSGSLSPLNRLTIVRGQADFTTPLEIRELVETAASLVSLPGAGHFPFYEAPDAFREIALRAFGRETPDRTQIEPVQRPRFVR
jgi:proline iminopeptidase